MKIIIFLVLVFTLTSCSTENDNKSILTTYTKFSDLPEGYSLEDAKEDQCVVFEDLKLTSGEEIWVKFLEAVESNETAIVRLANYYSEDSHFYLTDLNYDGSSFAVRDNDGLNKTYSYMNHYTEQGESNATYTSLDCYILVNDKDVTFQQLEYSLISSHSSDFIEQYRIYTNYLD